MNLKNYRHLGVWLTSICAFAMTNNVCAQTGGAPGGAAEEHPIVDAVHITGVKKLSEADLLKVISLKAGDKLSRASLMKAGNEIAAEYQKKGGDASDYPNITHPSDGHVVVELIVDESGTGGFHWPSGGGPGGPGGSGGPGGAPPQGGTPPGGTSGPK
jgi:hypothetical protein